MSSQEIDLTLTPEQAAHGVILPVTLSTGPARLRVPSCRDGELVRTRLGDQEVLLRIRVSRPTPPAPPPPPPVAASPWVASVPAARPPAAPAAPPAPARSGRAGCLVAVGLVAAVLVGFVLFGNDNDADTDTGRAAASATPTPSASPWPTYPSTTPSAAPDGLSPEPAATTPAAPPPTPFDKGTCLNGTLPDSTTAQRVDNVEEVACSASDAHYRVIESIPMTSDMSRCDDNPKTEYAFSYRYTLNGSVINQYVYCLIGLGSYAR
ncbi:hypothetical protein [Streptomyces sp. NPDC002044]|uniref:LppU/SCO3897 family protein n=1 Tax=Streptomyces sp. NPDC002044 TaxID=3154662 RepID=UPI00331C9AF2